MLPPPCVMEICDSMTDVCLIQMRFFSAFDQGHQQDEKQEGKSPYDLYSTKAGGRRRTAIAFCMQGGLECYKRQEGRCHEPG
jgi:hypothetical protein